MKLEINSRKLGRTLTFSRSGSHYVYVDINNQPGTLGEQICHGGSFRGSTVEYSGDDQEEFNKICRNWYRSYIKDEILV